MRQECLLIDQLSVAGIGANLLKSFKMQKENAGVQIQVDWTSLTGTLTGVIEIYQKTNPNAEFVLVSQRLKKVMNSATGSYIFLINPSSASEYQIKLTKNGMNTGTVSVYYNLI